MTDGCGGSDERRKSFREVDLTRLREGFFCKNSWRKFNSIS